MLKWHIERSRRLLSVMACLIVVLAGLSACAQGQGSGSSNTFAQPNNPITIGVSVSNSTDKDGDDFRSDAKATLQGYQLWQSTVNSSGGLQGRPVKLDILYDNSDPATVAANYKKLITQDHVDLVFGPFSSLLTKAVAPIAQQYGYMLPEGSGGAPSVFSGGWSNLFDVSLPVENNLITFAYYILSLPPGQRPETAAYLSSDDPFTFPQVEKARALLEKAGVTTVYPTGIKEKMPPDDSPLLNKLPAGYEQFNEGDAKTAKADADLVAHSGAEVTILGTLMPDIQAEIPEFKSLHYNPRALIATAGPDAGQDFINAVGGTHYTEGFFVPNGWYPQANTYQNAAMVQAYLAQYGGTKDQINADVAEAFSVGQVVQQAAEKVNSISNAKLIPELQSGDVFNTVQGPAQFSSAQSKDAGKNLQAIAYMFQWQGGQFIPVYPYSNAAQNPEYPKPAYF
jgi:branched-chain amino acid transport system substrate-binding protein